MEIERLINRHKNAVYRQMVRVCGNQDDAEDALAIAIFSAIKASDQLRDPERFQGWLAMIGTRACSRMRIRDRLVSLTSLSDLEAKGIELYDRGHSPDEDAELHEVKHCVMAAIESLPEILREVYVRREISGESAESVAKTLKLSVAAVKSRLHRARTLVRQSLESGLGCDPDA